ncbi:MAG: LD-carboxypeptidase [Desulfobacteraceae bacterium]|jgi:muramoyltetrapeptide carboxypeptidase|nr:LD-carboxypeptidase [Desulfobacteraceae bacterium]
MKSMDIQVPARLKPGDKIGIAAPAGPFDRELFFQGVHIIEEMGFTVYIPEGLLDARGYLAGPDKHRAEIVNQLFADKSIGAIICARGGYGSLRILHLLDCDTIAKNPKIFIGFSDITALLTVLFGRCGLVTFHGPVVTSLADAHELTVSSLFQTITSGGKLEIEVPNGITINPGTASGILAGGNLATLCHLVGTLFAPNFANKILFLEDRAEAPYKIDRMLMQMKLAECFRQLAGIVLGSFEDCGPAEDIFNIIKDAFADCRIPVLAGLDAGHGNTNLTLPMGLEVTLDADRRLLAYHRAATI